MATDLYRAIYSSRPFGYDEGMLAGILIDSRRLNARDDITGALICRADIYLQWLEGPEFAVRQTLSRIQRDPRHIDVLLHVAGPATERVFGEWAMLHDPAASWIWTPDAVASGAARLASPQDVTGFFLTLREGSAERARG